MYTAVKKKKIFFFFSYWILSNFWNQCTITNNNTPPPQPLSSERYIKDIPNHLSLLPKHLYSLLNKYISVLTTKPNKKLSSPLYEYTCKPWKMNSSLIHSITEMNLKRYGLITKILSAKKTYRLKFPIVDACVPASLSHVYICLQHLIYVYVGFIFFQKNLVTLICCYLLLSGGLNKWLLHLNAGKMRNKPDYTNQKQRYHSWLQRYIVWVTD